MALAERLDAPVCSATSTMTLPGLAPAFRRAAGLQRLQGGDGADLQGRCGAGAWHPAQPVLDAAGLRHRLLAEGRQDHPGRHQPRPHRPDQEGHRRHPGRRRQGGARPSWPAVPTPATRAARRRKRHRPDQVGLGAGTVLDGSRGRRSRHHLERARPRARARLDEPAHGLARHPVRAAEGCDHLVRHRQQLRHRQRLPDLRAGPQIPRARPVRSLRLRPAVDPRRQDRPARMCRWWALPATAPSASP
jgi:hypothetical protein